MNRIAIVGLFALLCGALGATAAEAQTSTELCKFMPPVRQELAKATGSTGTPECTASANINFVWEIILKRRADVNTAKIEVTTRKANAERDRVPVAPVVGLGDESYSIERTLPTTKAQEYSIIFHRGSVYVQLVAGTSPSVPTTIRNEMLADARSIDRALISGKAQTAAPTSQCRPNGTVRDHNQTPVPDVEVVLRAGTAAVKAFTDAAGRYEFSSPPAGFDAAKQTMQVEVVTRDGAHGDKPHFEIYDGADVPLVRSDEFLAKDGCQRDFHFDALPAKYTTNLRSFVHWPGLLAIFMSLRASWALADELGHTMTYGLPLRVYAWCRPVSGGTPGLCPDAKNGAHYIPEDGQTPPRPYIGLEDGYSRPDKAPGIVTHEFGHALLRDAMGEQVARTQGPGNENHGGYYVNTSTNDSWVEGWATFFAIMVQKRILKVPEAQVTALHGDMELDIKAWDMAGKNEEFALTGVLLDIEDGNSDYPGYPPTTTTITVTVNRAGGFLRADGLPGPAGRPYELTFENRGQFVEIRTGRTRVGPDGKFFLAMPIPKELTTSTGPQFTSAYAQFLSSSRNDDDLVDGDLAAIWGKIKTFAGSTPGGHIADATELMAALKSLYTGDHVEEIFVKHGFFADTADATSNQKRDANEAPGLTTHVGPPSNTIPPPPRRSPPQIPAMRAHVGGSDEDPILVQVSLDAPHQLSSYGYLATPDADGYIQVAPAPPGTAGVVSLLRLPPAGEPVAVGEISLDQFWTQAAADPGKSFMDFAPGRPLAAGQADGDGGGGASAGFILLLVAAACVGAYVLRSRARQKVVLAGTGPAAGGALPVEAQVTQRWATHCVPADGAWAWTAPDRNAAPATSLHPWLEVKVIELRADGWAHIECANSWTAWVDGRVLHPLHVEGPRA